MSLYGINNLIAGSLPQQYNVQLASKVRAATTKIYTDDEIKSEQYTAPNSNNKNKVELNNNYSLYRLRPPSFIDINRPNIKLSSMEFVSLQPNFSNNKLFSEHIRKLQENNISTVFEKQQTIPTKNNFDIPSISTEYIDSNATLVTIDKNRVVKDSSNNSTANSDISQKEEPTNSKSILEKAAISYSQALASSQQPMFNLVS